MTEHNSSDKKETFGFLLHHSKKVMLSLMALALLILVALGAAVLFLNDTNVVAVVNGEKIYLKDYQNRFKVATLGFSDRQKADAAKYAKDGILHDLTENKMLDKELAKRNLSVTDADLVAAAKEKFYNYTQQTKDQQANDKIMATVDAKVNVLKSSVAIQREGYILYCRFDRADQDDYINKQAEADKLRASNKVYAEDACNKAKNRLETGKSDFQTELKNMNADPVIGATAWKPWNITFGMPFDKKNFIRMAFIPETDIFDQIVKTKPDGENSYHLLTIKDTGSVDKGKDMMFAVLHLDKGRDGETTDFDKWFQSKWNEYKIKTYPERIK